MENWRRQAPPRYAALPLHAVTNFRATFPKPLITIKTAGGLSVLDGNHRVAAFCGLQKMPAEQFEQRGLLKAAKEQEVWLGAHSRGEIPLD